MIKNIITFSLLSSALLGGSIAYAADETSQSDEKTFGHLESLDRSIEAAGKEIQSLKMENQLKSLKKEAEKMQTDFIVLRIYGVDNHLKASLKFDNNTIIDVQAGDKIDERYSIAQITPKKVKLYDEKNKASLNAPFSKD